MLREVEIAIRKIFKLIQCRVLPCIKGNAVKRNAHEGRNFIVKTGSKEYSRSVNMKSQAEHC